MVEFLQILANPQFYVSVLRMATPLMLVALAGVLAERAGIITFSAEAFMLVGAFFGLLGSYFSDNVWVGFLAAMIAGGLFSLIYAFMVVTLKTNQIVTSVALILFSQGLTSYFFSSTFGVLLVPLQAPTLKPLAIPLLSKIPILGPILFNQLPIVYLALLMLPIVHFVLYKTTWGLNVRAVGDHPHAADTLGISVVRVRYQAIVITGLLGGIAGAFLSIGQLGTFIDNITGGRGFIAYCAIVFGRWTPIGAFLGSLLFGFADALQMRLQNFESVIPHQFYIAVPYILTVVLLATVVGKHRMPAASGKAFRREEH